jgi:uncharacterized protein with GYD domain
MAKYATFFRYSPSTWAAMIENPGDRTAAVRALADSLGGSIDAIYWMFGEWDGFVVTDAPSSIQAAALSVTVGSTGQFSALETHELLDQAALVQVLGAAKSAKASYRPPGT